MTNQERANLLIGAVFARLLPAWPNYVNLKATEISETAFETLNQADLHTSSSLIQWLNDEGYIRYKMTTMDGLFLGSVLTEKGLRLLNSVPEGISNKESYGTRITEAAKDVSQDAAKKTIVDLVGQMIGGVIKGMSSG